MLWNQLANYFKNHYILYINVYILIYNINLINISYIHINSKFVKTYVKNQTINKRPK